MDRPADRLRALLDTARRADRKVVVLGIGNELLGDDAVGDRVARELGPFNGPRFEAIAAGIAPENAAPLVSENQIPVYKNIIYSVCNFVSIRVIKNIY